MGGTPITGAAAGLTLFCLLATAACQDASSGADAGTQAADANAAASPAEQEAPQSVPAAAAQEAALPPGAEEAEARLAASPRHGEWVMIPTGASDSVRAWVVYPERPDAAPVVVVVHEIFGLSHWVRAVADQLAADGFIAIAPDLLTGQDIPPGADGAPDPDSARVAIRTLDPADVHRELVAAAEYGMSQPAARPVYGIVGFCWGGSTSFEHAVRSASLDASVVYYGTAPETDDLAQIQAPVLGLYGEDDARVTATIPAADSAMQALGKTYEYTIFPGAGHGFLRSQDGQEGANQAAAERAWPMTVAWFQEHLGEGATM